jgi:uncharacterized protein (DUF1800 family)
MSDSTTVAGPAPQAPAEAIPEPTGSPPIESIEPDKSRRALLTMGAAALAGAALMATPEKAAAQHVVRPSTRRPPPPPATGDSLLRLVRRITNGVTEEEYARAKTLGFQRYLDYHLKHTAIDDSAVDAFITTKYPELANEPAALAALDQNQLWVKLREATLYRAAFSKRQLYQRMVNFWSDHFSIYFAKVNYLKVIDDREVIRKHALGKFPDMLRASAHSPAMLEYLDNTRSRGRNVNQNYAREIMELHTLGVDGGYTQTDVEEVTKCLTGWTIQGRGEAFRFDPSGHDYGPKVVLGVNIPTQTANSPDGVKDGEQVLDMLVTHASTARFIAYKMIRWLLRYDPPADLVETVAATYTGTGGDIPSMIRRILTPANLMAAPAKYRQPVQLVAASLRALQPTVTAIQPVTRQFESLGQTLFAWEDPDGYPDNVDWWAGTIMQRWTYCNNVANMATGDVVVDIAPLMAVPTAEAIAEAINKRVFAGEIPAELKTRLQQYLAGGTINAARVRETLALAISSTSFQWF